MSLIGYCIAYKADRSISSDYQAGVTSDTHPTAEIFLKRSDAEIVLAAERLKGGLEYSIVEVHA